jgi:hypothetical protein
LRLMILTVIMPLVILGCNDSDNPSRVVVIEPVEGFIAEDRFVTSSEGHEVHLPMVCSHSLDETHPEIKRVLFAVPSSGRTIMDKYLVLRDKAESEGVISSTLVVGLQFLEDIDVITYELEPEMLFWGETTDWSAGGYALGQVSGDESFEISSYTIIDSLWTRILKACPNTEVLIMTGNSAGGSMTHHYAGGTTIPEQYPDVEFGFLPSNMVSLWYFTTERVVEGTLDQFANPSISKLITCPAYNVYPTGMLNLYDYMIRYSQEELSQRYASRNVVYFVGSEDDSNYGYCQLLMMGEDNYQRNIIYYNYLQHVFGISITENQFQYVVKGAGHNGLEVFSSNSYTQALIHWIPGEPFASDQ